MEKQKVVNIVNFSKKYDKKADFAVSNISIECYEGQIVGLLGHNGAGKSTTLKCLMGMLPITEGTIEICGYNIVKQPIPAKSNIGFVTDNHSVFVKMTGVQYLNFMADAYCVPFDIRQSRINELESCFQLGEAISNLISSYSHGMKQKICMMGSLMHSPKLWILDEPMTGLDPRTARSVVAFMRQYASLGNTILFSSHDINTVEKVCDSAVIIKKGKMFESVVIKDFLSANVGIDLEEYFLSDANS